MNEIRFDEVQIGDIQTDVLVTKPKLVDLSVEPTTDVQYFYHEGKDGYDVVRVDEVDSTIDENITPGNIKEGVSILGVNGTLQPLVGEERTITPTTSSQTITPSVGKNGITKATVQAVNHNIDNNIQANNIKNGITILGVQGNVEELKGETRIVDPSTNSQTITPTAGKNGITQVTVNPVTSSIDSDIQPQNIVNGVNILGVNGTAEGVNGEEITVTPNSDTQVITPSEGKNAITKVTVNPQGKYKPNFITFGYRRLTTNEELLDLISDINGVDTSNVTNISNFLRETFSPGGSLTEATLDLTSLNTSKVTDFNEAFINVYIPVTIDISTWDFTKITRENGLYNVFPGYSTTGGVIPIFPTNEQKVNTNKFNNLFYLNLMVKNLDLDFLNNLNADEPSATTNNTFVSFVRGCENLETLKMKNLSPYKLSSSARQATLSYMFTNCYKLKRVDADNFQFTAVRSSTSYYTSIFSNCGRDLPSGEYTKIYVKNATEQQWILNLGTNYRPAGWSTANIIIAGSEADDRGSD